MSDVDEGSNFAEYIARERERLHAEREQVFNQQEELQRRLDAINREFAAVDAYETAKTGKNARQAPVGRQLRARRGSRRQALIELIRQSDGLSRGEILERMGLKGDKSGEMSVSNALSALTKSNQVHRDGGKYRIADGDGEPAMTPEAGTDDGEAELPA